MLISELKVAFDIQHSGWFNKFVPLFWILWGMDFKEWVYDNPQYRDTFGILRKKKSLLFVLCEGSWEGRAEGRKGWSVYVDENCQLNLEFRF